MRRCVALILILILIILLMLMIEQLSQSQVGRAVLCTPKDGAHRSDAPYPTGASYCVPPRRSFFDYDQEHQQE